MERGIIPDCGCIDFSVSWPYWRDHCRTVHNYDPGLEPRDYAGRVNVPSVASSSTLPPDAFVQLKSEVAYLRNKLNEKRDSAKRKKDVPFE